MSSNSSIRGVIREELSAHPDSRGRFNEIFRASSVPTPMVQANHSTSAEGVLRGLHFHRKQSDLWYVVRGSAQVALADLRTRTEPCHVEVMVLESSRPSTLYIPPGVAHGFLALEALDLVYWVSDYYDGGDEWGVAWNDPTLAIPWQNREPVLSKRDSANPRLRWHEIPTFS